MAATGVKIGPTRRRHRRYGDARLRIILYFVGLLFLMGFPENVISIPISFFLKNKLHLAAHELAIFGLIAAIPI